MIDGVRAASPETLLVSRALDFLAAGPADARTLVAHVCQLPSPPLVVAEHLAETLLGARGDVSRDAEGRWRLAPPAPAAAPIPAEALGALSYAVVDVETTGGSPDGGDRVTEIAAVVVRDGVVAETFETLVNPQRPIPPWITRLTNISWEMVKDAPTFAEVCKQLLGLLEGRVFVAHNASFDWKFVSAEVARATGRQLEGRRLCTVKLARKLLPQLRSRSLDHVTHHYGVEIAARHRAAGDAVATAHCLVRMLGDLRARGCTTWPELDALLGASAPRRKRSRRAPALPQPVRKDTTA